MATKHCYLTIRVTKECKETIALMAKQEDRTVSNVANRLLTLGLLELATGITQAMERTNKSIRRAARKQREAQNG